MFEGKSPTPAIGDPARAFLPHRPLLRRGVAKSAAFGFVALALAVVLWGSGYRLSLYNSPAHKSLPRVPVAKLWIEHRYGFVHHLNVPVVKARIYAQPGASALIAYSVRISLRHLLATVPFTARPRAIPLFHAAIPLRSPPFPIS